MTANALHVLTIEFHATSSSQHPVFVGLLDCGDGVAVKEQCVGALASFGILLIVDACQRLVCGVAHMGGLVVIAISTSENCVVLWVVHRHIANCSTLASVPVVMNAVAFKCAVVLCKEFWLHPIFHIKVGFFGSSVVIAIRCDDFVFIGSDFCLFHQFRNICSGVVKKLVGMNHIIVAAVHQIHIVGKHGIVGVEIVFTHNGCEYVFRVFQPTVGGVFAGIAWHVIVDSLTGERAIIFSDAHVANQVHHLFPTVVVKLVGSAA